MSQQEGYSPSFKRPAEIMRMRRKRTRSDASVFSSPSAPGQSGSPRACVRPFSPGPLFNNQNPSGRGTKRRNPFANIENTFSPKKKFLIYNDDGSGEAADSSRRRSEDEGEEEEKEEDMLAAKERHAGATVAFRDRLAEAELQEHQDINSKVALWQR